MSYYNGNYRSIEGIKFASFDKIKSVLEKEMENYAFEDYETAHIIKYNLIGRQSEQYYFSMRDKQWHCLPVSMLVYNSWAKAKEPFASIARWCLTLLGYNKTINK